MTKSQLITIIRDSLVTGNQSEAEQAIDEFVFQEQRKLRSLVVNLQKEYIHKIQAISLTILSDT